MGLVTGAGSHNNQNSLTFISVRGLGKVSPSADWKTSLVVISWCQVSPIDCGSLSGETGGNTALVQEKGGGGARRKGGGGLGNFPTVWVGGGRGGGGGGGGS